jgi:transglutaminase-like putative cysteine protease
MREEHLIKKHCKKCKHTEYYTDREFYIHVAKKTLRDILIFLGIVFILVIIVMGPTMTIDYVGSSYLTLRDYPDTLEMRKVAINMTTQCIDAFAESNFCYAFAIYDSLKDERYVPASLYDLLQDPEMTLDYGGDCKHLSMLYTTLARSVGIRSRVMCSIEEEHCIAVVPRYTTQEYNHYEYAIIDLTMPGFFIVSSYEEIWDYQTVGVKYE